MFNGIIQKMFKQIYFNIKFGGDRRAYFDSLYTHGLNIPKNYFRGFKIDLNPLFIKKEIRQWEK